MSIRTNLIRIVSACIAVLLLIAGAQLCCSYADDESVTVYLSISDDSEFIKGNDPKGSTLVRVPVKVSYRDLAELGMQEFYRREALPYDEGGEYIPGSQVIEEPTVLMLFLRALELYYLNRKLETADIGTDAFTYSGSATSLFIERFFNHDLNFMYYYNHAFPEQSEGRGATCDYIILGENDEVDVAFFTDYEFHTHGCFAFFDTTDYGEVNPESSIDITLLRTSTEEESDGSQLPLAGEQLKVSSDYGNTWNNAGNVTDTNGHTELTFNDPGVYIVSAGPDFHYVETIKATAPCVAPPSAVVRVRPDKVSGLKAAASEDAADLTWNKVNGAESYTVTIIPTI